MTAIEIKDYVGSLVSHITFEYNNKNCGVDPFRKDCFEMWYGNEVMTATSIDEVLTTPFFEGKSLNEIANVIELD